MITPEVKQRVYKLLTESFPFDEPQPFAKVALYLTKQGIKSSDYGYAKMKPFLSEMPEFLLIREILLGQNPQQEITLRRWKEAKDSAFASMVNIPNKTLEGYGLLIGKSKDEALSALSDAYARAKAEGRLTQTEDQQIFETDQARILLTPNRYVVTDSKPWHLSFTAKTGQIAESQGLQGQSVASLTQENKKDIYFALSEVLPKEETLHMAVVSKVMNDAGHSKEQYGFYKMKLLLQELGEFLSLEEAVMGGVPQTLVTLHAVPDWDQEGGRTVEPGAESVRLNGEPSLPHKMMGSVQLLPKTLAKLNLALTGVEAPPTQQVVQAVCAGYDKARATGTLRERNNAYLFSVDLRDKNGEPIYASIKRSDYGVYPWYLNFAGVSRSNPMRNPGKELERFAFLGSWSNFLEELERKALPEPWDFEDSQNKKYFILQKYIQYTFYRLQLEDKVCVAEDGSFAAFNTGLVTQHYDDLYACFEPSDESHKTKWRFLEFCTAAGRGVGKRRVDYFNPLPQPPSYFECKEDLLFDLEKELHTDYEHILLDNVARLPLEFLREECHGMRAALEVVDRIEEAGDWREKKLRYQELSDRIAETPRLFNRLRNRLEDAIEMARKQVRWNYKTAIPCFFPTRNVMSLMLPLSLQDDSRADAALVVERTRSGNYQGQTILTLQQAYLDGRLLCRPNSEWLDTRNISGAEDDVEEDEEE